MGQAYKEIDLDENPCIFPRCGHFLTMESMDAQMDLSRYYRMDAEGKPTEISMSSQPFSMDDIKTCAICRGPLRDISRYGRLVRRAILDESTKKLILYLHREYVPLAQDVSDEIQKLQETKPKHVACRGKWPTSVRVDGTSSEQAETMKGIMNGINPSRWKGAIKVWSRAKEYRQRVAPEEQPFNRVRNLVKYARRRKAAMGDFEYGGDILQTKGTLQASALSLRLHIALMGDFLSQRQQRDPGMGQIRLDLEKTRGECGDLINAAGNSKRILQQVEGHIFLAQLHGFERSYSPSPETGEDHLEKGRVALENAKRLCSAHPGQTVGLADEVEGAEKNLQGSFYTTVTTEERMAVIEAIPREFRGTGHWYYCQNGHPFTIGECGGAVQVSLCPECGEQVGGQHHQVVEGVTRATDLEDGVRRLGL